MAPPASTLSRTSSVDSQERDGPQRSLSSLKTQLSAGADSNGSTPRGTKGSSFISNLLKLFSEKDKGGSPGGSPQSPPLSPTLQASKSLTRKSSLVTPATPPSPAALPSARRHSASLSDAQLKLKGFDELLPLPVPQPLSPPRLVGQASLQLIHHAAPRPPMPPLPPLAPPPNMTLPSPRLRKESSSTSMSASQLTMPMEPGTGPQPQSPRPRPPMLPPTSPAPAPRRVSINAGVHVATPSTTLLCTSATLPPKMQRASWSLSDYAIFEKMYTGYASVVHKAWCKRSGEVVCLKLYNLGALGDLHKFQIYREVKLHSSMQHQHVIHLLGAFQQGEQVVLVQEYAEGGDLFLLLHRHGGKLAERQAVELVMQPFLLVLNYLHQQCIAHRDLKPENILFTRTNVLKLCDFGLAIDMREERAVTRAGTLEYMAPEVLNCPYKTKPQDNKDNIELYYSTSVDAWAVGILTYELLVGMPPFSDSQRASIEDKIRNDVPKYGPGVSELARHFIGTALQKDAHLRPTVLELLHHPWIQGLKRSNSMRKAVPPVSARPMSLSSRSRRSLPFGVEEGDDEGDDEEDGMESAAASAIAAVKLHASASLAPARDPTAFRSFVTRESR